MRKCARKMYEIVSNFSQNVTLQFFCCIGSVVKKYFEVDRLNGHPDKRDTVSLQLVKP